jgi:hypothetical protein
MKCEVSDVEPEALFFGVIVSEYPRNRRLREFLLQELNTKSRILSVDDDPGYLRKSLGLLRRSLLVPRGTIRLIVVPEFSLKYAAFAWLAAKYHRAPLLVDWFVGLYETRIGDWGSTAKYRAKIGFALDQLAIKLASLVVTDTEVRAQMLHSDYGAKRVPIALPVGAPDWAHPLPPTPSGDLRVLYYGSYQPLHGLDQVVNALSHVSEKGGIRFTLIGAGNTRPQVEQLLQTTGIEGMCTFIDSVPEADLRTYIAEADIVLGIFGESKKASSVIANKVWQGLACNRVVLTRANSALSELREMAGSLLVEVDDEAAITRYFDQRLFNSSTDQTPYVADIDLRLEAYVRSKYEVLRNELVRKGLS